MRLANKAVFEGELAAGDGVGVFGGEGARDALSVFAGVLGDPQSAVVLR